MKPTLPDFAVSSAATGFDEFLRLINHKERENFSGSNKYYGYRNGELEIDDYAWTTNFLSPHEAIALLTGKQLTEGDKPTIENACFYHDGSNEAKELYRACCKMLGFEKESDGYEGSFTIVNNTQKCIEGLTIVKHGYVQVSISDYFKLLPTQESVESQPESKQGICLECGKPLVDSNSFGYHNHCSEIAHASQPEIVPVQEESRGIPMPSNEWFKEMRIKITKELFPESTQEVKWLISTEEIEAFIKSYSPFGTKTVGNWNFQQQLQVFINERISQQTAHFQQQLKEAKELLIELESYLDDEVAIVQAAVSSDNYACINDAQLPSLYLKINQFLTRNK